MSAVKLYSAWFCPFAQRAWIALLHKGVPFEYIEQDPYDKTPEWLAVNPKGLVPVIVHNGNSIYESSVCVEYVDEAWPNSPALLPKDPYQRAVARIWSDHITKKIVPPFYALLMKPGEEDRENAKRELLKHLGELVQGMSDKGPFFAGEDFGLVDIMLIPFALRYDHVLKVYRNFEIPKEPQFERYHRWYSAVKELESVKKTVQPESKLAEKYKRYADDSVQSQVGDAVRQGKTLP